MNANFLLDLLTARRNLRQFPAASEPPVPTTGTGQDSVDRHPTLYVGEFIRVGNLAGRNCV